MIKLNGFPAVPKLAVRLRSVFAIKLPKLKVVLVGTGTWIPQRGSGPRVVLYEVPSGKVSTYLGASLLANTLSSRSNVPESKSGKTSILRPLDSTTCRAQAPRASLLPFVGANTTATNRLSCFA